MATIDLNQGTICINPTDDLTLYDKNNIMSRIEKFLFAICSLDSSDLPVPLSRIEELYYCLVTGDTPPTFEPLSRAEKFLMACLGVYDINKLPEPLSRSEVLLKKIAIGDSNLEDVDNLQSKYEFLLAYIIQNGGIGDFDEYVLNTQFNTLYNTKEKPIKSAILKGMTVNCLLSLKNITANASAYNYTRPLNVGETYTIFYNYTVTGTDMNIVIGEARVGDSSTGILGTAVHSGKITEGTHIGKKVVTLTDTSSKILINWIRSGTGTLVVNEFYCVEGDYSNIDIPFIPSGLNNVKMPVLTTTGKNILNINENNFGEFLVWGDNGSIPVEYIENEKAFYTPTHRMLRLQNLKPNKTYTLSFDVKRVSSGSFCAVTLFMGYSEEIGWVESENNTYIRKHYTFTTTENVTKIEVTFYNTVYFKNLQLVEGTITEYEPYKSNILTVNEPVELRGIGDIKDELNLLTGELTERVGEIVLDGSEEWIKYTVKNDIGLFHLYTNNYHLTNYEITCVTPLKTVQYGEYYSNVWEDSTVSLFNGYHQKDREGIAIFSNIWSVDEFKSWLSQNPLKLVIILKNPTVKTVDLSVVDQDGNDTKLSTFNDITHVTLSSEGLIPEAELEVATKNEEDLEDSSVYTVHTLSEEFNTLYNTEEKPVKSAILKGNTLVNLVPNGGERTLVGTEESYRVFYYKLPYVLAKNKKYILYYNVKSITTPSDTGTLNFSLYSDDGLTTQYIGATTSSGFGKIIFTTLDQEYDSQKLWVFIRSGETTTVTYDNIMLIEYQEGMENWDIPYFEGMASVKMPVLKTTGKNLFDEELERGIYTLSGLGNTHAINVACDGYIVVKNPMKVNPNTTYTLSHNANITELNIAYLSDYNNKYVTTQSGNHGTNLSEPLTFTTPSDCQYIKFYMNTNDLDINIQIEQGSVTTYEPHKSNILTVNEDVELRGIGDVKDTLDCLRGELTQKVENVLLTGDEVIELWSTTSTEHLRFFIQYDGVKEASGICNKFINFQSQISTNSNFESIACIKNGFTIVILKNRLNQENVDGFKQWLKDNSVSITYQLEQEVNKTVDLSVVDQDGNDTKLSTFNDITHVTLSSEGLIPEAELEVAEKVPEIAASILTISREQEVIDSATNKQSENVDATMIATTEIYEGLL